MKTIDKNLMNVLQQQYNKGTITQSQFIDAIQKLAN